MKVLRKITVAFAAATVGIAAFAPQSHAETGGKLGYDKALVYESPGGKFKIKQNFRIQFRADFVDTGKDGSDLETDLMVRRMKMKFGGHAYEPWLQYGFQLAGSAGRDNGREEIKMEDAFIVIAKTPMADLKVGRHKVPYEREVLNSSSALQFIDRSLAKEAVIEESRGDGITVGGIFGGMLAYRAGVFQFDDEKFNGGKNLLLAGRLQANICCGELKYSSGSFTASGDYKIAPNFAKVPVFSIGLGGFTYGGDPDSRNGFTADLAAKIERANFEASVNYGSVEDGPDKHDRFSYRLQAGYMLTSDFEAAVRWAAASFDDGDDEREITFGLNYYLAGHRAKVQVDYSNINTEKSGGDERENRVRAQIQVYL